MGRIFSVLLLFIAASTPAVSQELPAWVHMGKGLHAYHNNDFSTAMLFFQQARRSRVVYPEADFAIALVYDAELNFDLAERYYLAALETRRDFAIQEDVYLVQYKLARLYWLQRNNVALEQTLQNITNEDMLFSNEDDEWFRNNSLLTFMRNGLDNLLLLYRREQTFSYIAHRELGIYYTIAGRDSAIEHIIMAIIQSVSPLIAGLQKHMPLYEFSTLADLLQRAATYPELQEYINNNDVHRLLFFLGKAAHNFSPESARSREVWQLLATMESGGRWSARAQNALIEPSSVYITDFSPRFP